MFQRPKLNMPTWKVHLQLASSGLSHVHNQLSQSFSTELFAQKRARERIGLSYKRTLKDALFGVGVATGIDEEQVEQLLQMLYEEYGNRPIGIITAVGFRTTRTIAGNIDQGIPTHHETIGDDIMFKGTDYVPETI